MNQASKPECSEIVDEAGLNELEARHAQVEVEADPELSSPEEISSDVQEVRDEFSATLGIGWQALHGLFCVGCVKYAGRLPAPLSDGKADMLGKKSLRVIHHFWPSSKDMEGPVGSLAVGVADAFGESVAKGKPVSDSEAVQ